MPLHDSGSPTSISLPSYLSIDQLSGVHYSFQLSACSNITLRVCLLTTEQVFEDQFGPSISVWFTHRLVKCRSDDCLESRLSSGSDQCSRP